MVPPPPAFWVVFNVLFGAILGSYVNMAAYRLPRFISTITRTRSFCPKCEHQLAWFENIPVLSFLALRGRCRSCHTPIPSRYLWVELLVAALFGLIAYQYFVLNAGFNGPMPLALAVLQMFLIVDLVLISVVDLEMWVIPLQTTLPWALAGLVLAPIFPELHPSATVWWMDSPRTNAIIDSLTGMIVGAGAIWTIGLATTFFSFCYFKLRGDPRRPLEGMGDGDTHLMALAGAMLGWKPVIMVMFVSVVIGAVTGVAKIGWERLQRWRLGERYKPWQPTYEHIEEPAGAEPQAPLFWLLLVFGVIVMLFAAFLYDRSISTWDGPGVVGEAAMLGDMDARLIPVAMMFALAMLLVFGWLFKSYLAKHDLMPQGEIVENDAGKKEEVLQGNYIPFGPSLAAAALLVALYDPLLRHVALWFFAGAHGTVEPLPWRMAGGEQIMHVLTSLLGAFNALTQWLARLLAH